jgi:hypothetical protein
MHLLSSCSSAYCGLPFDPLNLLLLVIHLSLNLGLIKTVHNRILPFGNMNYSGVQLDAPAEVGAGDSPLFTLRAAIEVLKVMFDSCRSTHPFVSVERNLAYGHVPRFLSTFI